MWTSKETNLSPQDLQGKYTVALGRICENTGSDVADRQKPIHQMSAHTAEQRAIREAANALTALWKIKGAEKA
jgi:hypothetical protein